MSSALTLLIVSSVGWTAPEMRPAALEVELMLATVETVSIEAVEPAVPAPAAVPATGAAASPAARVEEPAAPAVDDVRSQVTYSLALPWFRTKP